MNDGELFTDLSAPWMPTTYKPNRCGYLLKGGGVCQMREGHYAKGETDHGKPDHWRDKKRCPNRNTHTPGVTFKQTGEFSGYHIFIETGEACTKTHVQRQCPGCELFVIWVAV